MGTRKCYCYRNSAIYPRVEYFQRMLTGLLPRFKRVVCNFDSFYQDKERIEVIEHVVKGVLQSPCVLIINESGGEFDLSRTAAAKSLFKPEIYVEEDPKTFRDADHSMTVIIFYHEGTTEELHNMKFLDDLTRNMKEIKVEMNSSKVFHYLEHDFVIRSDESAFSKLFIACDVRESDSQRKEHTSGISTEEIHEKMEPEIKILREDISRNLTKVVLDEKLHKQHKKEQICGISAAETPVKMETEAKMLRDKLPRNLKEINLDDVESIQQRLLVGAKVDVGVSISKYLESQVFLGFDNIDNYLREFRKHDPTCYKVAKSIGDDKRISKLFEDLLSNICTLSLSLSDLHVIRNNEGKSELYLENKDNFFTIFIVFITLSLKSIVVQIVFEKFSLSQTLTHKCLEKVDFQEKAITSMENNTDLKVEVIKCVHSPVTKYLKEKEKKQYSLNLKLTETTTLVKSLVDELKRVFEAVEKEVEEVDKCVDIVKKMNFEVSGYYKRTQTREERTSPKVAFSKELQSDMFSHGDIIGCGFVYGIFEILIKEECEDDAIKDTIDEIMKHHRYIGQYNIKRVQRQKIDFMAENKVPVAYVK